MSSFFGRNDTHTTPALERDGAFCQGEEGEISTHPHVSAGLEFRAHLTHDDAASLRALPAIKLDATVLRLRVAHVAR